MDDPKCSYITIIDNIVYVKEVASSNYSIVLNIEKINSTINCLGKLNLYVSLSKLVNLDKSFVFIV